jgi:hypothetical protein
LQEGGGGKLTFHAEAALQFSTLIFVHEESSQIWVNVISEMSYFRIVKSYKRQDNIENESK